MNHKMGCPHATGPSERPCICERRKGERRTTKRRTRDGGREMRFYRPDLPTRATRVIGLVHFPARDRRVSDRRASHTGEG